MERGMGEGRPRTDDHGARPCIDRPPRIGTISPAITPADPDSPRSRTLNNERAYELARQGASLRPATPSHEGVL